MKHKHQKNGANTKENPGVAQTTALNSNQKQPSFFKRHHTGFMRGISITAGLAAVGGGTGLIYGIASSISQEGKYVNIVPYDMNAPHISYAATAKSTEWSASEAEPLEATTVVTSHKMNGTYPADNSTMYDYSELILNGSQNAVLDKSFNQSAYRGSVTWKSQSNTGWTYGDDPTISMDQLQAPGNKTSDYSGHATKPTSDDNTGFSTVYDAAIRDGTKVLALCGYNHVGPLTDFRASDPDSNQGAYILIDGQMLNDDHIASVQFRTDQSAFLATISACQYLEDNYESIYSHVNGGKLCIGVYGGMAIPTVTIFMGGAELGIWFFNNYILPIEYPDQEEQEQRTIHLIDNGCQEAFFTGTFTIGDARLMTQELLSLGADIIFPIAGPQTADTCAEIQRQGVPCRVIGVDTDQENSDLGNYTSTSPYNKGEKIIYCSAEKNLAFLTAMELDASARGIRGFYWQDSANDWVEYTGKKIADLSKDEKTSLIGTYGYTTVANANNNGIMVSEAGQDKLIDAFKKYFGTLGKTITDWDDCLDAFDETVTEIVNPSTGQRVTLADFLDSNMYFIY